MEKNLKRPKKSLPFRVIYLTPRDISCITRKKVKLYSSQKLRKDLRTALKDRFNIESTKKNI